MSTAQQQQIVTDLLGIAANFQAQVRLLAASILPAPGPQPTTPPATTSVNVALASAGAVASTSSVYSAGYPASAVNNGERAGAGGWGNGTQWVGQPNSLPAWAQINFSGAKTVSRVVVYTVQDDPDHPAEPTDTMPFTKWGCIDFTVQGWNGTAWDILATIIGNNLVKRTVTSFTPMTTDRIRVYITKSADGWPRLTEIEAF